MIHIKNTVTYLAPCSIKPTKTPIKNNNFIVILFAIKIPFNMDGIARSLAMYFYGNWCITRSDMDFCTDALVDVT